MCDAKAVTEAGAAGRKRHPREGAGPLSALFFWWTATLFRRGGVSAASAEEGFATLPADRAGVLVRRLERAWRREQRRAPPQQQQSQQQPQRPQRPQQHVEEQEHTAGGQKRSGRRLARALLVAFWPGFVLLGVAQLFLCFVVRVAYPLILGQLVASLGGAQETSLHWAGALVLATFINLLFYHHTNYGAQVLGMRMRVCVSSLVFRKALRLSLSSSSSWPMGQVVTLLSSDASRLDTLLVQLHYAWLGPLQALQVAALLWLMYGAALGVAAAAGVAALALQTLPVQSYLARVAGRLRLRVARRTDERLRLLAEALAASAAAGAVKMLRWEWPLERVICEARRREVRLLLRASFVRGVYLAFMVFSERSSLFVALLVYSLLGYGTMSADRVFMLAQIFNILQLSLSIFFPVAVQSAAEAMASLQRIEAFLALEEKEGEEKRDKEETEVEEEADDGKAERVPLVGVGEGKGEGEGMVVGDVSLRGLSVRWQPNSIVDTLSNVTLSVPAGKLCIIVGSVGAGKTTLLLSLLRELRVRPRPAGPPPRVLVNGRVAFASQEPWLFAATLQQNVLLGRALDEQRYRRTIRACALERDLQLLPRGDRTAVGERGGRLSGGQKARVNLARAVYGEADVYLLDDPLSAVDAHVGQHLFTECVCGFLAGKTRILVTHQLQHLRYADHIVVLNHGRVEAQGSFEELAAAKVDFTSLLSSGDGGGDGDGDGGGGKRESLQRQTSSTFSKSAAAAVVGGEKQEEMEEEEDEEEAEEAMAQGALRGGLWLWYARLGNSACQLWGVALLMLLGQLAASGCDVWAAYTATTAKTAATTYAPHSNYTAIVGQSNASDVWTVGRSEAPFTEALVQSDAAFMEGWTETTFMDTLRQSDAVSMGGKTEAPFMGALRQGEAAFTEATDQSEAGSMAALRGKRDTVSLAAMRQQSEEYFLEAPGGHSEPPFMEEQSDTISTVSAPAGQDQSDDGTTGTGSVAALRSQNEALLMREEREAPSMAAPGEQNETASTAIPLSATSPAVLWPYGLLVVSCAALTTLRALAWFWAAARAARALHDGALGAVLRAPLSTVHSAPAGRVLNRFSKDAGAADELLPRAALEATQVFLVMASILVMVVVVTPYLVMAVAVLGVVFFWLRARYLATAQDIKRLEGITKSPVYSHVASTLLGLVTVRAAGAQGRMRSRFDELQDANTVWWQLSLALSEALGLCLDALSLLFVGGVALSVVLLGDGAEGAAWAGLALSQALVLTGMVQHGVRLSADAATHMTAVERLAEYAELAPEDEIQEGVEKQEVPEGEGSWPARGDLLFESVSLRYLPSAPPALDSLCLHVPSGLRVGVVGRTGAGKSSLLAALFRLAPLEGGALRIDGVDIRGVPLRRLRRSIGAVPQTPALLPSQSLRFNLCPPEEEGEEAGEEVDDAAMWAALRAAGLGDVGEGASLDAPLKGEWSEGQRQLLCIARALLSDARVVVIDEATANVDPQTDALIQEAVRLRFAGRTVLTVAHRLRTVADSNRVLVMDAGRAVEYDHPHILLQNKEGYFYALVHETGKAMAEEIAQIAEEAYNLTLQSNDSSEARTKEE